MTKIAFIGAGSYGFTHRLLCDILSHESLRDSELSFQDVIKDRLAATKLIATEYLKSEDLDPGKATFTTNRRRALEGADFVIDLVKIGFHEKACLDLDIPKKYGLKQTIGDTCCVAGVFRGLRTMPFVIQLCQEIEEVGGADPIVLNYTNPQSMLVMAAAATSRVPFIGLCHSVQGTTRQIAQYMDIPYEELVYQAAGINHMSWVTKLEHKGKDVYPRLRRLVQKRGIYGYKPKDADSVEPFLGPARLDMLNRIGYCVTESSTHFPEYVPYYARTAKLMKKYQVPVDQYKRNMKRKEKNLNDLLKKVKKGKLPAIERSVEFGSAIMNSKVTGEVSRIHGNVPNASRLVTNLPENCAVEVACLVDRNGVQPCHFGALPTQCAAMCAMDINVHQLAVEAILERDRKRVVWALMMDPLTHSLLDLDQMEALVDELVEAQPEYLGKYLK